MLCVCHPWCAQGQQIQNHESTIQALTQRLRYFEERSETINDILERLKKLEAEKKPIHFKKTQRGYKAEIG